jgi:CrcB protein
MEFLLTVLLGAAGVAVRWGLQHLTASGPWLTAGINIAGCAAMGATLGLSSVIPQPLRIPVTVGLLGGFTTFSAWAGDILRVFESGDLVQASLLFVVTPTAGMTAAWLCWHLTSP